MEMTVWLSKYRLEYSSVFPYLWEFINCKISVISQFQNNRKGKTGAEGVVQLVERLPSVPAFLIQQHLLDMGAGDACFGPAFERYRQEDQTFKVILC